MSFLEATTIGNKKQDKFFGLDKTDASLKPQKCGYLAKRPFASLGGLWRKRFFAIKDSFILWYDHDFGTSPFDTQPKGCLPLNGAAVKMLPDKLSFEVVHPALKGSRLICKAPDQFEADEWVSAIKRGMNATWDNAIVGFALMEKMKAKGTALEQEKEAALKMAEKEAEKLRQEREESEALARQKLEIEEEINKEAEKAQSEVSRLKHSLSKDESSFLTLMEEHEIEKQKKTAIIEQLQKAKQALLALEQAFKAQQKDAKGKVFDDSAQVTKNVSALKSFFEDNIKANENRRAALEKKAKGR